MNNISERDIAVIMSAGRSRSEAERHLTNGTTVYTAEDFEKNITSYIEGWGIDEEEAEKMRQMVKTGDTMPDWEITEYDNAKYYIAFVL